MLPFLQAHFQDILNSLLGLSEVMAIWAGKGGILISVINGLKSVGAKEPGA